MYTYDVVLEPNYLAFEKAGFSLTSNFLLVRVPMYQTSKIREVTEISGTPDGWHLAYRRGVGECLIDQDGFLRCRIEGHTFTLISRYRIFEKKDGQYISICFGNEQEILYERKMKISYMDSGHLFYDFDTREERERLRKEVEAFANKNYPHWRDVNAYWDNKKDDPYSKKLTI